MARDQITPISDNSLNDVVTTGVYTMDDDINKYSKENEDNSDSSYPLQDDGSNDIERNGDIFFNNRENTDKERKEKSAKSANAR